MDINKFEERIKSVFGQHRPAADTDAIWKNIEPQLRKKKKRRGIIWFWGLLGLGLLLFFSQSNRWKQTAALPTANNTPTSPAEPAAQGRGVPSPVRQKTFPVTSDQPALAEVQSIADRKATGAMPASAHGNSAEKPGQPQLSVSKAAAPEHVSMGNDQAASVVARPKAILPLAGLEWEIIHRDSVPDTSILQLGRISKDSPPAKQSKKREELAENEPEDEKKRKRRKRWTWQKLHWEQSAGLQAGPALAIKQLRERDGATAPVGLLKKRQTTEHTMESYTVSMFYAAATRQGLMLKTGLNYRQSNEKFHLGYLTQETERINGVLTVTVDGAGSTIDQTTGLKTVIKTTEYSNTAYSHYRFVHLPVGVGYRHTGKKTHWELSGGMDLNLFFRADGTMYNRYNVLESFRHGDSGYEHTFRNTTGMGLWLGYAYDWRLTDQWRWQLSANAQVPLHSVSSPDYALVQRYLNVGLQVGVVYVGKKKARGK